MSITNIIKEALNEDPLAMKASIAEELQSRVRKALEEKMKEDVELEDDEEDDEDEDDE